MNILGWWKKRKATEKTKTQLVNKGDKDICPECGGRGYSVNDNHYLADGDDYEQRYQSCRRCHGTGRYHSDIDKY